MKKEHIFNFNKREETFSNQDSIFKLLIVINILLHFFYIMYLVFK